MSANKYFRESLIEKCRCKMIIRNLSKKKFKVIIQDEMGQPITKDDFHITVTGDGHWNLEII